MECLHLVREKKNVKMKTRTTKNNKKGGFTRSSLSVTTLQWCPLCCCPAANKAFLLQNPTLVFNVATHIAPEINKSIHHLNHKEIAKIS